jgi:hypothetical protein
MISKGVTVKDLEDLVDSQKKLLDQLRGECKTLNDQLQVLAVKYRNDTSYLATQCEEMTIRMGKFEERSKTYEEQSEQHNEMHEKMKLCLKEMTAKMEEQREAVLFCKSLFLIF